MVSNQAGIGGRRVYSAILGDILEFQRGGKLDVTDREKRGIGESEERGDFCIHQKNSF